MNDITAPLDAAGFPNNWVFPHGVPQPVLTDNCPQFIAQLFPYICAVLGMRRIYITAYHPQSKGQAESYNKSLADRLRHYVSDHQPDWDLYVQPLTYSYSTRLHKTTGT